MTEYEVATGAVIYSQVAGQLQYLLVKSKDRHFWGFAKGHVEAGETKTQAAIREIKEETNLDVTVNTAFTEEIRYPLPNGKTKISIFYVSEVDPNVRATRQLAEISDIQWFDFETALAHLTHDNLKSVLKKANAYLLAHA